MWPGGCCSAVPAPPQADHPLDPLPPQLRRTSSIGSWLRGVELDLPHAHDAAAAPPSAAGGGCVAGGGAPTPTHGAHPAGAVGNSSPLLSVPSGELLGLLEDLHADLGAPAIARAPGRAATVAMGPVAGIMQQAEAAGLAQVRGGG